MSEAARAFAAKHYPFEEIMRVSHRPRDAWVISKKLLGIQDRGRSCPIGSRVPVEVQGDKLHAVRLYMQSTGSDLDGVRKVIESNMVGAGEGPGCAISRTGSGCAGDDLEGEKAFVRCRRLTRG